MRSCSGPEPLPWPVTSVFSSSQIESPGAPEGASSSCAACPDLTPAGASPKIMTIKEIRQNLMPA